MIIAHKFKINLQWRKPDSPALAGTIYFNISCEKASKILSTRYKIYPDEWDAKKHRIVATDKAARVTAVKIAQLRVKFDLARLQYCAPQSESLHDLVSSFESLKSQQFFFSYMEDVIEQLIDCGQFNTAKNYISSYRSFFSFCQNYSLAFSELTPELLEKYEAMLKQKKIMSNTSSFYLRTLRAVYLKAVEQDIVTDARPFRRVFTGVAKTVKRAITDKEIQRIKSLDLQTHPALDIARDVFLFSFYGRGMSLIDLAHISTDDLKDGYILYSRSKTQQALRVKILPQMQETINKYRHREAPYILPLIKGKGDRGKDYDAAIRRVNNNLKKIAAMARIKTNLTTYVARHSWATICKTKNVPIAIISDGLGHDSISTTEIYLKSFDQAAIDAANELVTKGL